MITQRIIPLTVALLFLTQMNGYGQVTMSREQEREIKTSGKYYYGECSAFDAAEAKECALSELTQVVLVNILQESIKSEKPEILLKNMEMMANTARLIQTGRIKIIAWIAKDSVNIVNERNVGSTTVTVPSDATLKPQQEVEVENETSRRQVITNPIMQDLADSKTHSRFISNADGWKRQGKLVYGNRKASFTRPDSCHIAVFSSSGILIALLGKGNNARMDLLSGKTIQNPEQYYKENQIIWIQIL